MLSMAFSKFRNSNNYIDAHINTNKAQMYERGDALTSPPVYHLFMHHVNAKLFYQPASILNTLFVFEQYFKIIILTPCEISPDFNKSFRL